MRNDSSQHSFDKLAKAMSSVYGFQNAGNILGVDYEKQVRSKEFIKMLTFNCFVMNALYKCRKRGCSGCKAQEVFMLAEDKETKAIINTAMRIMNEQERDGE